MTDTKQGGQRREVQNTQNRDGRHNWAWQAWRHEGVQDKKRQQTLTWHENLCSTLLRNADRCARSKRVYSAFSMLFALTAIATRKVLTLPGGPHRPSKLASLLRACATAHMLLDRACKQDAPVSALVTHLSRGEGFQERQ